LGDRKPAPVLLLAGVALVLVVAALMLAFFVSMKKESSE